ncbi:MAG: hypothetical protein FGM24_08955 [Candidatus Kapabacteria bacterium]|nr:hypothetical protein [Candidatus Kapabacteria bacterium]
MVTGRTLYPCRSVGFGSYRCAVRGDPMRSFAFILAAVMCATATAQVRVDVGASVGFPAATTSFQDLQGFATCCPSFDGGSGIGPGIGIGLDIPVTPSLFGSIRLGLADRSHALQTQELVDLIVGNTMVTGTVEHTMDLTLRDVSLEGHLGYRRDRLSLRAGVGYGVRTFGTLRAAEEISDPAGAVFVDSRSAQRNIQDGVMPDAIAGSWQASLTAGLDIPIGTSGRWNIVPEVSLTTITSSLTSATSWHIIVPAIGVRLAYVYDTAPEVLPPVEPEPAPPVESAPIVQRDTAVVEQAVAPAVVQHDVRLSADAPLGVRFEEIEEERLLPLLPYVFFERNEASIPERYRRRPDSERVSVSTSGVAFHHRLLSVIAERLRLSPLAGITLVGTTSSDENDSSLALRRARNVASVLIDSFRVRPTQIRVRSRGLPAEASVAAGEEAPLADEENRRVEIESVDKALLDPYRATDTVTSMTPSAVAITATTTGDAKLQQWRMRVNGVTIKDDEQALLTPVIYSPTSDEARLIVERGAMQVTVAGSVQMQRVEDTLNLPIQAVRLADKRRERRNDSIVERYELIVFPYNRADLTEAHRRIVNGIRQHISAEARIDIEGCSDVIGPAADNKRLSAERARAVASALGGAASVKGRGEPDQTTSQRLPEERMLQRVVKITVVIPTQK